MRQPSSQNLLEEAEEFFHSRIPLTRAMGLRVRALAGGSFAVEAPVALNHNHLQTAFGGSINAVATLAAYAFLWLRLRGENAEMVVAESTIRFLAPVHGTISAVCTPPERSVLERFEAEWTSQGRARIRLHVVVSENGTRAAEFRGSFVARRA